MKDTDLVHQRVAIPITATEIGILADKAEGWKNIWGRIYGLLGMALEERIDRLGASINWPVDGAKEEFAALMLTYFERRFDNGQLFSAAADRDRDLVTCLLAFDFLYRRAITFLKRRRISFPRSLDAPVTGDSDGDMGSMADSLGENERRVVLHDNRMHAEDYAAKRDHLDRSLTNLSIVVATPMNPTTVEQQAGMQLYPRCDWSLQDMRLLHSAVKETLASGPSDDAEAVDRLRTSHLHRRKSLEKNFADTHDDLANLRHTARKKFFALVDRMNKTTFEYLFRPLDAEALMSLLAIQRDNADMLRKRYRDKLEALLHGNADIDGVLAMEDVG